MASSSGPSVEQQALHIPRLLRTAEIVCADGGVRRGRVFLPAAAPPKSGAMGVAHWLEESTVFFPFLPDGEGRPVLVNKEQLLVLTVAAADAGDPLEVPAPRRQVRVRSGTLEIEGEIAIEMPATHSRVLDVLNRPDTFLAVTSGTRVHFIRKSQVVRVDEPDRSVQA